MEHDQAKAKIDAAQVKQIVALGGKLYAIKNADKTVSMFHRYVSPVDGKTKMLRLESFGAAALERARVTIEANEKKIERDKADPKLAEKADRIAIKAGQVTFEKCATEYMALYRKEWTPAHATRWAQSLKQYAYPLLGRKSIGQISKADVVAVLEQRCEVGDREKGTYRTGSFWETQNTTAQRVRNRIELVWAYAEAADYVSGDNPALWANMRKKFAPSGSVHRVRAHRMIAPADAPALMAWLQGIDNVASKAAQFTLITGCRANTTFGMRWAEVDMAAELWTVPASRMKKNGMRWRTSLPPAALAILRSLQPYPADPSGYVFASAQSKTGMLSPDAMHTLLARSPFKVEQLDEDGEPMLGPDGAVIIGSPEPHGLRGTLRTWWQSKGTALGEAGEFQIAHVEGSATVLAYKKSDLLETRAPILAEWSALVAAPVVSNVVGIRSAAS
jgi:integrase